jgi:hypothetical protein
MSETEVISVGEPMPRLASVDRRGAYEIVVGWAAGSTREHNADLVDLAPLILTHKLYKPLRDNPHLLATVHMIEDGSAVAWGSDDAIDMAATSIERLAEEQMTTADFRAWLEQHKLTCDAAAAQLGISRRLVAYYADQRPVPRYIALACRYLDLELRPPDNIVRKHIPPPALLAAPMFELAPPPAEAIHKGTKVVVDMEQMEQLLAAFRSKVVKKKKTAWTKVAAKKVPAKKAPAKKKIAARTKPKLALSS